MKLTRKDFKFETFTAGGPGGQHQNRSNTAVRITHIETGLSAESREYKSQAQNKKSAFEKLAELLTPWIKEQMSIEESKAERNNSRIRTYNEKSNEVSNTNGEIILRYDEVMKSKDISKLIHENRLKN